MAHRLRKTSKQPHPERSGGRLRYAVIENRYAGGDPPWRVVGRYDNARVAAGMAAALQRLGRDLRPIGSTYGVGVQRGDRHDMRMSEPIAKAVRKKVRASALGKRGKGTRRKG